MKPNSYRVLKGAVTCPRATLQGYSKLQASAGDLVEWGDRHFGRVVGIAESNGLGEPYAKPVLAVLEFEPVTGFCFMRQLPVDAVRWVARCPSAIATVFFSSTLPDPNQVASMDSYGCFDDDYIGKYLDDAGNIVTDWESKTGH
jgi:hypothetical protein